MTKLAKKNASEGFLCVFRAGIGIILLSALLFLLGFATDHWHRDNDINYGLWVRCKSGKCERFDFNSLPDYHIVTQVCQIITAVLYALSPVIHFIMYCWKKNKSTDFRTRIFDIGFSVGTVVHFVSVIVFGLKHPLQYLSWSYNMSASGLGLGVIGVFLTTISREKALHIFGGLPGGRPKHSRVGALVGGSSGSSRPGTPLSNNSFIFHTQRSIQSQNSIEAKVFGPSNQQGVSRVPNGTNVQDPLRTPTAFNVAQNSSATDNLLLQHGIKPSTSAQVQLAPLRANPKIMASSTLQDIVV